MNGYPDVSLLKLTVTSENSLAFMWCEQQMFIKIYIPYIDMQWLKGLSFWRLLNVARVFSPEKDPSTRLCLDVTQVWPPWTFNLFFHVERLQCLVQSHKNLCVDKALRNNELICRTYKYKLLKYVTCSSVFVSLLPCRPWILTLLLNLRGQHQVNMLGLSLCLLPLFSFVKCCTEFLVVSAEYTFVPSTFSFGPI